MQIPVRSWKYICKYLIRAGSLVFVSVFLSIQLGAAILVGHGVGVVVHRRLVRIGWLKVGRLRGDRLSKLQRMDWVNRFGWHWDNRYWRWVKYGLWRRLRMFISRFRWRRIIDRWRWTVDRWRRIIERRRGIIGRWRRIIDRWRWIIDRWR